MGYSVARKPTETPSLVLIRQLEPFRKHHRLRLLVLRELGSSPFQWSVQLSYSVEASASPSEAFCLVLFDPSSSGRDRMLLVEMSGIEPESAAHSLHIIPL